MYSKKCIGSLGLSDNGFNPMRWDCEKRGCFNVKKRPKIEVFAECFPGKIAMSDVDGIVEVNSRAMLLEWKSSDDEIPKGQRIMFERISKRKIEVFVVCGDAENMEVEKYRTVYNGKFSDWVDSDLNSLKRQFEQWCAWAIKNGVNNP